MYNNLLKIYIRFFLILQTILFSGAFSMIAAQEKDSVRVTDKMNRLQVSKKLSVVDSTDRISNSDSLQNLDSIQNTDVFLKFQRCDNFYG